MTTAVYRLSHHLVKGLFLPACGASRLQCLRVQIFPLKVQKEGRWVSGLMVNASLNEWLAVTAWTTVWLSSMGPAS